MKRPHLFPRLFRWPFLLLVAAAGGIPCAGLPRAEAQEAAAADLSPYYGFKPLELFKVKDRSANMLSGDFNHDGLVDLVLIDNSSSRLDLLLQKRSPAAPAEPPAATKVNDIKSDLRFEFVRLSLDRAAASMAKGDFNGDGRADLAYFGIPDRLVIRFQPESGDWAAHQTIRVPDVVPVMWILAAGDLNGDGKDDLALLGKNETHVLYQQASGEMAPPVRLMNTSDRLSLLQIADLDGDGRQDLVYLGNDEVERILCARLQTQEGKLGPEQQFEIPRTRALSIANLNGQPGEEVLTIESTTNRVKVHQWVRAEPAPGEVAPRLTLFGFGAQGSGRDRDLAVGDINADGLTDVVVTDPESAQMIVYEQAPGAGLSQGATYAGLVGTSQVRVGDVDGDARGEVIVLSVTEKSVGCSRMASGRLTFPELVPLDREPVAIDLADVNGDGRQDVVVVSKGRGETKPSYALRVLTRPAPDAAWAPIPFGSAADAPIPSLKSDPTRLVALDANRDGKLDYFVFQSAERGPLFLLANDQGLPVETSMEGSIGLAKVTEGGVFLGASLDPVVLVAQSNFARQLRLADKNWQVVDQFNAPEAGAKVAGVARLDLDGQPGEEIVLVDLGTKRLRVLRLEGTVYRPWREVEIGAFPFTSAQVADLNGDKRPDLVLCGKGQFGVLYAGGGSATLKEIASFESKLDSVRFGDLVVGDLNGDRRPDVAVFDMQSQYVEVLAVGANLTLRHATHFKVFESKGFTGEGVSGSEPRESLIADVTGDGLDDLVLLSHDRVIVYPQDDGK